MLIAMFVMAWVIPSRMERMSSGAVFGLFVLFSALMGCWLAPIFLVYRLGTIVSHSFITAGTFGAMSVYGYSSPRPISPKMAPHLMMALSVSIIKSVWSTSSGRTPPWKWIISIAGVLIFTGLTARHAAGRARRMVAANLEPALADKACHNGCHEPVSRFHQPSSVPAPYSGGNRD